MGGISGEASVLGIEILPRPSERVCTKNLAETLHTDGGWVYVIGRRASQNANPGWKVETGGEIRAAPITLCWKGKLITVAVGRDLLTFGLQERGLARGSARLSLRENRFPSEMSCADRKPPPRFEQALGL